MGNPSRRNQADSLAILAQKNGTAATMPFSKPIPQPLGGLWGNDLLRVSDELDRIAESLDRFRRIIGDLDAKFFLERHYQLDCIERIRAQIVNERRVFSHFVFIYAQMLDNNFLHATCDIAHVLSSSVSCVGLSPALFHWANFGRSIPILTDSTREMSEPEPPKSKAFR